VIQVLLLQRKNPKKKSLSTIKTPSNSTTSTKLKAKTLNIYQDPELLIAQEPKASPIKTKAKERKPLQVLNAASHLSYSFDGGEGIPIVDEKEDKGGVYLGNMEVAQNLQWLKDTNIIAIVNAASEIKNFYPSEFQYKKLSIIDSSDYKISKHFDEVAGFIDEQRTKGSVLVHCQKGQSRSVTFIFFLSY